MVKQNLPCSLYDVQGLQTWLDEMAAKGLFFQSFSRRKDYANFSEGVPRPVRYRLDPVGRSRQEDQRRKEPYAQMGWDFVDALPRMYYVFSCDDPEAPELHSDPQTLAYALGRTIQTQIRFQSIGVLISLLCFAGLGFLVRDDLVRELLLLEHPRLLFLFVWSTLWLLGCTVFIGLQIRRLVLTRRALAQGLAPKAGRRWTRPRWIVTYLLLMFIPLYLLPRLIVPQTRVTVCALEGASLSRSWPTLEQLEGLDPDPLPPSGYLELNHSYFVPVQEFESLDRSNKWWMTVRYCRARSPWAARQVYQIERDEEAAYLENAQTWEGYVFRVSQLTPFAPLEYPGLDALEIARFQRFGQDCWAFAALRGDEVLVVEYTGHAHLEDSLPLFLAALDQPMEGG